MRISPFAWENSIDSACHGGVPSTQRVAFRTGRNASRGQPRQQPQIEGDNEVKSSALTFFVAALLILVTLSACAPVARLHLRLPLSRPRPLLPQLRLLPRPTKT